MLSGNRSVMGLSLLAILALPVVAFALIGCGSGDSGPLKKSAFVEEANAICVEAEQERKQGTEDLVDDGDVDPSEEAEVVSEALVSPVQTMTEELGDLSPPKGDEKQVKAIVAAFEDGVAKVEADPVGAEEKLPFAKANELALEYGLTDCTI
ncbi:MAG TPA: hypothetical protein VMS60_00670 [Solirubrobacterales bacterium]|nr:hypothetical protein [Solirubrobacterales bacterium]